MNEFKTRPEVQRAHDMLVPLLLDELPLKLADINKDKTACMLNVLCWVLGHEHDNPFPKYLAYLEKELKEKYGLTIENQGN